MTNPYQPPQGEQPQYPQAPYQQPPQQYAPQPYQQPYQQGGYGQQPGYGYPAAPPTNTLAIVSLVSSLATFVLGVTAIVGVITGHMALGQIRRTGEGGRGMALAGLIVGYVFIGFTVLAVAFFVIAMVLGLAVPLAVLGTSGELGSA